MLGVSKILLDDQDCSNKNDVNHIRAQAVALDDFNYCQRHTRRVLGCSKGALQKNVKKYRRKRDI